MLLADHNYPDTYKHLLTHPVWDEVFAWIKTMPSDLSEAEHTIRGRELYVNHFTAETKPRSEAVYEAHQNYIDFHYCLDGGELIEWAPAFAEASAGRPVTGLQIKTPYNPTEDYALYQSPEAASSLIITPKSFAIFFPNEAHMPKISDGKNTSVHKLVFKIKIELLH